MAITASRVFHVNVNCADLDRSLAFYRDRLGLVPGARTTPTRPQPGGAFALDEVQWDAWMMMGASGPVGPVIDLLEWKVPRPTGTPRPGKGTLGIARLRVTSPAPGATTLVADPDGTALDVTGGREAAVTGVVIGCTDRRRTAGFFTDLLGFERRGDGAGAVQVVDRAGTFVVDLVESEPGAPLPYATANHLGMYRMAMLTDAIDDDFETLRSQGVRCYSAPATLDMGPGLPLLRALFFADPDGTTIELIESPTRP